MFSIIIPAYNEEQVIVNTMQTCQDVLQKIGNNKSEIIIIDDGSNDRTNEFAHNAGCRVIVHPHNIGYGRSLKDGISAARNDTIIITDADGTYPVERIPDLLNEYKKGFNMVVGARQGKHYDESFFKKLFRIMLKWMVEFTAGRQIDDINSGFRIFSKKEVQPYFLHLCDTFSFTTSLTLAYMLTGKFVKYTPIAYHKRIGKTKVRIFRDSLRTMQYIVEAIMFYNPIKIFLIFAFMFLLLTFGAFMAGILYSTKMLYAAGIFFLGMAVIIFGFGLLSVQLRKIMQVQTEKQE